MCLLGFVLFEELSRFFEGEGVSVDDQLVVAGIVRDGKDALDLVAVLAQGLDDEIDVYHAWKCTAAGFHRDMPLLHMILNTPKSELGLDSVRRGGDRFVRAGREIGERVGGDTIAGRCGGIGGSTEGSFHTRRGGVVS